MEIAEFLLARIAEDEKAAREAADEVARLAEMWDEDDEHPAWTWKQWSRPGASFAQGGPIAAQVARNDPARVLAKCEAKRRIVEHHAPSSAVDDFLLCSICTEVGPDAQGWPCLTLRLLALPYADHPDYRPEWKP